MVFSGNFATPWELVRLADASLPWVPCLRAQSAAGTGRAARGSSPRRRSSARDAATIRGSSTCPCGCRSCPACSTRSAARCRADPHLGTPHGRVSLGSRSTSCPRPSSGRGHRGAWWWPRSTGTCPTPGRRRDRRRGHRPGHRGGCATAVPAAHRARRRRRRHRRAGGPLAADGGTLQLGIGQIPDTAARHLAAGGGSGCGRRWSATGCSSSSRPARWTPTGPLCVVPVRLTRALRSGRTTTPAS